MDFVNIILSINNIAAIYINMLICKKNIDININNPNIIDII